MRTVLAVVSFVVVVVPVSAQAQTVSDSEAQNEMVIAMNRAGAAAILSQADFINDLARCQIVAAAGKVPGDAELCPPPVPPAMLVSPGSISQASVSPSPSPGASMAGTCVAASRSLTNREQDVVNEYEIVANRAISSHLAAPAMPPEVSALVGCL
jgi:hypothetical protein